FRSRRRQASWVSAGISDVCFADLGKTLWEDFLKPLALSPTALANAIGVAPRRINEIVLGKRAVTADTDLRLARYFRLSDGFFLEIGRASCRERVSISVVAESVKRK